MAVMDQNSNNRITESSHLAKIDRLLNVQENVLWSGKPEKKAFVMPALGSVPFGLFFLVISLFMMSDMFYTGAPDFVLLFITPFVLVALVIIFVPIILQLLRYRNTEYVITDKRIITQSGAIGLDTRFVDFDKIQEVYVKVGVFDRLFGTGSLQAMTAGSPIFGPAMGPYGYGFGGMYGFRPSLSALKEPYQVQKLLQEALERSKATSKPN
jgi:membrane protein YdbS with pleckstrin-like domain